MPSANPQQNGLTADQIATLVGISERSVRRRAGIDKFEIGTLSGGGRPATVYDKKVLIEIFNTAIPDQVLLPERTQRIRADRGCPRGCEMQEWELLLDRTHGLYMANAQPNLRMACEHAIDQLKQEGNTITLTRSKLYSILTRKSKDGRRSTSPFYEENWELLHETKWRKHKVSKMMPTAYYDWQLFFESAGWARPAYVAEDGTFVPGFGAHRIWSLDGHKGDVWTTDNTGKHRFPYYIYVRDALTGYPLYIQPIESESSKSIMMALVNCMLKWRRVPDLAIAMDNAVAGMTNQVLGVIASMLDPMAWDVAGDFPEIYGSTGSPIIRNIPNVPKGPFKAAIERSFKQVKDEHDATRFPRVYQGGSRQEAVQLMRNNRPSLQHAPTRDQYFASLERWSEGDYITRERPDMFPSLVKRGIAPTIDECFELYGGNEIPTDMPDGARMAKILYWATDEKSIVTAQLGQAAGTINGEWWPVVSDALDNRYYRQKVAIVPLPGNDERALLLLLKNGDPTTPEYIGWGVRAIVNSIHNRGIKNEVMSVSAELTGKLSDARAGIQNAQWRDVTTPAEQSPAPRLTAAPDTPHTEPIEVDSRTMRLLKEIDDELNNSEL